MKNCLVLFSLLFSLFSWGQNYHGRVLEKDGDKPVQFAVVYFIDAGVSATADSLGKWSISDIPGGNTEIIVTAPGMDRTLVEVDLVAGKDILLEVESAHHELDKVIVSNHGLLQRETITNVELHSMQEIMKIPSVNLGQALANIPGVYQTSIGNGVSKPVIRGLSGSRVVTYLNGLRIENQQWGGDHGLPITSLGVGNVEVIKGPSSLLYGSDAMGGVLYFVDEPFVAQNTYSAYVQSRFDSNTLGTSNEAGIRLSKNKIRFNAYGGYDNHADYSVGNGRQVLNSRFNQASAKLSLGYLGKNWVSNLRYNFYRGRIGLPGHTHDLDPNPESFLTTNQNRSQNVPAQQILNHFVEFENKFFVGRHKFLLTLGNTNNDLKEFEEKFFFPDIIINLNNSLYNFRWNYRINEHVRIIAGSQGMMQVNRNGATAVERLIPDANTNDLGAYSLIHASYKKWNFQAGARWDNRTIETQDETVFSGDYTGYNFSTGLTRMGEKSTIRFNVSSGFRAPTTSELLSDGIHHGTFRYEVGNRDLTTEQALQLDLSYALHLDDLELIVNPFYSQINNYIYITQTDSFIDGFRVYEYTQADLAELYGVDFGIHYHPHKAHWLHLESSFSTVIAEDNLGQALPLIPQSRINTQIKIKTGAKGKFTLTDVYLQHLYYFEQLRVSALETPSPDYNVVNAGIDFKLDQANPLTVSLGVRNVLNELYIDHLSVLKDLGLTAPGFNAYVQLKFEIRNQLKSK